MDEQNLCDCDNLQLSSQLTLQANSENSFLLLYQNQPFVNLSINSTELCFTTFENQKISIVRPISFSKTLFQKNHPLSDKSDYYCQIRYVVLLINEKYLICKLSGNNQLQIELNPDSCSAKITTDYLSVELDVCLNLHEVDSFIVTQNIAKYNYREFSVGLVVKYTQKIEETSNFALLCGTLCDTNILLIANDCEIQALETNDFILDTLVKKASLCNAKLILESSMFADKNSDSKLDFILQRNSTPVLIDGYPMLNILSKNNEEYILANFEKLQKISCGLRQKMLWEYDIPEVEKCLLKDGASIVEFGAKIDDVIEENNNYCQQFGLKYNFIENFFDEKSISCDMIVNDGIRGNITQFIYNLILNGYTNISLFINEPKMKITNTVIAKKLFPIFLVQNLLLNSDFMKKIADNKNSIDYFIKLITFRQNLDIMYADFVYNKLLTHSSMFELVMRGKKNSGIIFKNLLYICLPFNSFFRSMIFLPNGYWFDIEQQVVLSGGYYLNTAKSDMKFFLKQDTILIEKNSKTNEKGYCDLQITIFCKDKIHTTIYENDKISHKFDVQFNNDVLNIEYDTTAINRMITFIIVTEANDKTLNDAKSINYNTDEIFFTQDGNILKFLTCNIQNHNEIKIC